MEKGFAGSVIFLSPSRMNGYSYASYIEIPVTRHGNEFMEYEFFGRPLPHHETRTLNTMEGRIEERNKRREEAKPALCVCLGRIQEHKLYRGADARIFEAEQTGLTNKACCDRRVDVVLLESPLTIPTSDVALT